MSSVSHPVSVRISPGERDLLEAAAAQGRTNLSDFIRRTAIEAAERAVLDDRVVTVSTADWERFENWARAPAKSVPALKELSDHRPTWED